jgi:hypothetical protein
MLWGSFRQDYGMDRDLWEEAVGQGERENHGWTPMNTDLRGIVF